MTVQLVRLTESNAQRLDMLRSAVEKGTFAVRFLPWGIAFDGVNMWVANEGNDNVTKLRASDGSNLGTFSVGSTPLGIAFDGANIWVANGSSGTVSKL